MRQSASPQPNRGATQRHSSVLPNIMQPRNHNPIPHSPSAGSQPTTKRRMTDSDSAISVVPSGFARSPPNSSFKTRLDRVCEEMQNANVLYAITNENCQAAAMPYRGSDTDIARYDSGLSPSPSASATDISALVNGLSIAPGSPLMDMGERKNMSGEPAGLRTNDDLPKLGATEVVGHAKLRDSLDELLVAHINPGLKDFYLDGIPARRTLHLTHAGGTGVRSLITSVCRRYSVNLLRLTHAMDVCWRDDSRVANVLDAAILLQPCVVFFDKCDGWFGEAGYPHRGEKFVLALKGRPTVLSESSQVYLIYSGVDSMDSMVPFARRLFGVGITILCPPLDSKEVATCVFRKLTAYMDQLNTRIREACQSEIIGLGGAEISGEWAGVYSKSERICRDMAVALAPALTQYTPAMISEYMVEVFRRGRERSLATAKLVGNMGSNEIARALMASIPCAEDFQRVSERVLRADPNQIVWKTPVRELLSDLPES